MTRLSSHSARFISTFCVPPTNLHKRMDGSSVLDQLGSSGQSRLLLDPSSMPLSPSSSPPTQLSTPTSTSNPPTPPSSADSGNETTSTLQTTCHEPKQRSGGQEEEDSDDTPYCICNRKPSECEEEADDMMIECEVCHDWLHGK